MQPGADARAPDPALRTSKQALRGRILASRDDLPAAARQAASAAIAARILALPSFARARTILMTLPFRSEWDTLPLAHAVLRDGRRLVLPRVDREARMLVPHAVSDLSRDVVPGYLGVPEPRGDCPPVPAPAIDWVLVPGVAYDAAGRRLGYGGGFYDRLLPALRSDVPRIGGAFELQIVDEVPSGAHDQRVDVVVTEVRTLAASLPR